MAQRIVKGIDSIFDIITFLAIVCGGVIFHLLTCFAVKGSFGVSWGVVAFVSPGVAELGYAVDQLADGNLKYPVLLCLYIGFVAAKILLLYGKKLLMNKLWGRFQFNPQP